MKLSPVISGDESSEQLDNSFVPVVRVCVHTQGTVIFRAEKMCANIKNGKQHTHTHSSSRLPWGEGDIGHTTLVSIYAAHASGSIH